MAIDDGTLALPRAFGFTSINMAVALVLALTLLGQCEANGGYDQPTNCKRLECAPYKVISTPQHKDFEIRSYKNATWISTSPIISVSYKDAAAKGFNILFSYIQGNNKRGAKIDMTAPVFVDVSPSVPATKSSFVVHFYVPDKYQQNPPLSNEVHPVKLPKQKRYAAVRRFGGFMNDSNIIAEASALKQSLKGTKWESSLANQDSGADTVPYTVAGYNSPFEYNNRVNEVIFWVQ